MFFHIIILKVLTFVHFFREKLKKNTFKVKQQQV